MSAKRQQATKSKCTESKIPKLMDPTMQQVNESENNASNAFFSLCSVQTSVPSTSESKNINKQLARDGSECILIENFNESGRITQISSVKPSADTSEFSVPTSLSDVMLIVEGKRLHVNRAVIHFIFSLLALILYF
uniref:Uncharacterized protein n=1 Tax=Acrobeloides nanus TaxID=290746 RepID=A0A914DD32_9BILA